jgi:hypothetical protein
MKSHWCILLIGLCLLAACSEPAPEGTPQVQSTVVGDWWRPEQGLDWQAQYVDELDLDVPADVFSLDLFETTPEQIAALHARGAQVVCYLNAGAWEDWRPESGDFPAAVLGADYAGWPGERWLDIRRIQALAPVIAARFDLCAEKGFDGVDTDNLDGYTNATGFPLSAEDQLAYNRWLAGAAHARELAIGLKNDPAQATELAPDFDWITTESCFAQGWCEELAPFLAADKPVFDIEYTDNDMRTDEFCPKAAELGIDAILKHRELDSWRETCP